MFKRRHLIVTRRENLTSSQRDDLVRMLEYLPELGTLRRFADRIYWVFDTPKDFHQASCRRAVIVRDAPFQAVPELAQAMEQLNEEKFAKLMAYLKNPVSRRVRSNNHLKRTNRMIRLMEKVRYKWRRRCTLARFVVLTLDKIWKEPKPVRAKATDHTNVKESGKMESQREKPCRAGCESGVQRGLSFFPNNNASGESKKLQQRIAKTLELPCTPNQARPTYAYTPIIYDISKITRPIHNEFFSRRLGRNQPV